MASSSSTSQLLSGPQLPDRPLRLLVLGAGIVGVSTAVALQEFFSPPAALSPYASLPATLSGDDAPLTEPLARSFDYASYLRASLLANACGPSGKQRLEQLANKVQVEVTIVGENFTPSTTGDVAAGLWTPISVPEDKPEVVRRVLKWGKATWELLAQLQKTELQQYLGIFYAPLWKLFDNPDQPLPFYAPLTLSPRRVTREEIAAVFPECPAQSGFSYISQVVDTSRLNHFFLRRFLANGGHVVQRRLASLADVGALAVGERFDCVFNCLGLAAREIFGDLTVFPQRGQLYKVKAPATRVSVFYKNLYVIPNLRNVVVGGTFQNDDWLLEERAEDRERIIRDCHALLPSMRSIEIPAARVGLRPCRADGVRVEFESLSVPLADGTTGDIKVVHQYGHAGSGFTLFWGTTLDALQLAIDKL